MSQEKQAEIQKDVAENKIVIYMKGNKHFPQCGFSAAVVDIFKQMDVPFETRDVLSDEDLRGSIKEFTNWPTIPQVFIQGKFIGGCDITMEMAKNGELAKLVQEALN